MLTHPNYDRAIALGLAGMARALPEQRGQADASALTFEDANHLKFAGLRQNAVVEDIDLKAARGLDRAFSECRRFSRTLSAFSQS
jgi:hypothetical protein